MSKKHIKYDSRLLDIGIESNNQTTDKIINIKYDHLGKDNYLIELKIDATSLIKKTIEEMNNKNTALQEMKFAIGNIVSICQQVNLTGTEKARVKEQEEIIENMFKKLGE